MYGILTRSGLRNATSLGRLGVETLVRNEGCRTVSLTAFDSFRHSITKNKEEGINDRSDDDPSQDTDDVGKLSKSKSPVSWSKYARHKYERFSESSTQIIYDFDEEQRRENEGLAVEEEEKQKEEEPLERGITGVFDIEELVDLLREENARDIAVVKVPKELKYTNYIVFASSKSIRHMTAVTELLRRVYKKKMYRKDRMVLIEGKNTDWVAMDLGNIALHLMSFELREEYDLETLWTVGSQYDEKCHESNYKDLLKLYNYDTADQFSPHKSVNQPIKPPNESPFSNQDIPEETSLVETAARLRQDT